MTFPQDDSLTPPDDPPPRPAGDDAKARPAAGSGGAGPAHQPMIATGATNRLVRYHERWLTAMLHQRRSWPRIPIARVSEGGFAALLARGGGRLVADHWWEATLEKVPA